ncbi:UPF0280 family protein [bacterium]|nr:UPF0280 family protein [bacterium]
MNKANFKERFYRDMATSSGLKRYTIKVEETDLLVMSQKFLKREVQGEVVKQRDIIKRYIEENPEFYISFSPLICDTESRIIKLMCLSSEMTDTGPMASVSGAIAEVVGEKLFSETDEIFIENGGDIYARMQNEFVVAIYAGTSPFSMRLGIKFKGGLLPLGIATSSGTVGHSFSYGNADAVTVVSRSATFSDGAATYFCNIVKDRIEKDKIEKEIKKFPFIEGMLIIKEREMFLWGNIELISL